MSVDKIGKNLFPLKGIEAFSRQQQSAEQTQVSAKAVSQDAAIVNLSSGADGSSATSREKKLASLKAQVNSGEYLRSTGPSNEQIAEAFLSKLA